MVARTCDYQEGVSSTMTKVEIAKDIHLQIKVIYVNLCCRCEKFSTFDVKNSLQFWYRKLNENKFTDL